MITISVQQLLTYLLLIVAIVAVAILAVVFAKLIPTLKSLSKTMENVAEMSTTAKEDLDSVQGIISNVATTATNISGVVAGNRSTVKAATNLVNAAAGLARLTKNKDKDK
ncbi:MAG: hypothetical protein K5981_00990 [Clostridia bacterium]|jgi:uncharacterized protein YoxC|nr:hypothetical protein [Clostridia bacterium]